MNKIGLRKEEKAFETRVAITPDHAVVLNQEHGIKFIVEPSNQRAFSPDEYKPSKAEVFPLKGSDAKVVLGIKEMPIDFFEPSKVYVFFSHTVKGQKYNMPMLKRIMDTGATLIDYEKVVDEKGRRLIYFGNWAGLAGMSDTLRVFGERLTHEGISPNPFEGMRSTLEIKTLEELKEEIRALGERISSQGLPDELSPLVVGFAGYGNVSKGAQELFDILPHETVEPEHLHDLPSKNNVIYKCIFKEEHMVKPIDTEHTFDLQDYYANGSKKYKSDFERYIPYLTIIMNCIYWTKKYPRLITKDFMKRHWSSENRRLRAIGDISCDIEGSIEFTLKCTKPDNPAFTYIIEHDSAELGVTGDGPVIMAVDNLPCELPREASSSFSETLRSFIPSLAKADFEVPFENLNLPRELLDAIIVYQGKLTKSYEYLQEFLSM
ncbi:MAG: hypothetical protein ACFFDR_00345 [Candidatus Thorarchaeota archaeon]